VVSGVQVVRAVRAGLAAPEASSAGPGVSLVPGVPVVRAAEAPAEPGVSVASEVQVVRVVPAAEEPGVSLVPGVPVCLVKRKSP
jgi:hypothetical protein